MNKIFRVKWNTALKRFDVTSELTKGKIKSSSGKKLSSRGEALSGGLISLSALLMALTGAVQATDIDLDIFNSKDGGHTQNITGDDNLVSGGWGNISSGDPAAKWVSFADALAQGKLRDNDNGKTLASMAAGNLATGQMIGYEYVDQKTGNIATFQGYDNGQLKMANVINQVFSMANAVGVDGQYVDRNLIQVNSGGKLAVNVGDTSAAEWYNDTNNQIKVFLKGSIANPTFTSSVFKVGAASTLDYNSKTIVHLGNFSNQAKGPDDAVGSFRSSFTGAFSSAIGPQQVDNVNDLKAYNSALIAAVKSGALQASQYDAEFKKAYGQLKEIFLDEFIADNDAARQIINYSRVAYLLGDGAGTINLSSDAVIEGFNTDISMVRLVNGSTLNNYGEIGSFSNSSAGSQLVSANRGSVVNNYGVLDAGTNPEMAKYNNAGSLSTVFSGNNEAIITTDAKVNNYGVINIAPNGNYKSNVGVNLFGSSEMVNSGNLNTVAITRNSSPTYSVFTVGVQLNNTSKLTNTGTLYLGREAQRNTSSPTNDISTAAPGSRLVFLLQNGEFVNDITGIMTLGTLTQGGYGAYAQGSATKIENSGTININGKAPGSGGAAPLQNVGIFTRQGASNAVNTASGNIILDGINAVAMMASSAATDTANSGVRNNGTITIKEGIDPGTKTANYGLWAEGSRATATNAGTIDLQGDGAIAAHARNGGTIQVDGSGHINFGGINQTGYYVFGAGSKVVDSSTGSQNVTTEGSTLYRIDGGASFDGNGNTTILGASGKNSTALLVTSNGASSLLNSGDMTLAVSGEDATGIKVMGSAQGTLSDKTKLTLSGAGSSAGIVDGSYTDIIGTTSPTSPGTAKLTSFANLDDTNATGASAIGYIARNNGTLDHQGSIHFADPGATGVLVDGGTLDNSGNITVNGTAVNIQGMNSTVTNSGTVEATDGTAAFLVGNNAHLDLNGNGTIKADGSAHGVLLATGARGLTVEDATIAMSAGGTGTGIENQAEIAGIKLDNTTINVGNGIGVRTAATLADTNSGRINVEGSGTGILFGHADGTATSGDLDTSKSAGLIIDVNNAAGKGMVTNTSGDVLSGVSVNVNDQAGGPALTVGGSTRKVEQSGVLTSESLTSAVVDLDNGSLTSFINSGDIIANSAAQEAIKVTLGSNISFTNDKGGNIKGRVDLADGNNTVTLVGGSTADDVITGSGNDNFYLNDISESDNKLFTSLQAGSGSDTLNLNNSSLTVTSPALLTGFELVSLTSGSHFTLDNTLLALGDAQDDGVGTGYTLSADSTLTLKGSANTDFASHINGTGTVATDLAGNSFDFTANNATNGFTGTLGLANATLALDNQNTAAMTNATLRADNGGIVTVGNGSQEIGGLAFDGGTVRFATGTPGHLDVTTFIAAHDMDLSGDGTIEISAGTVDNNPTLPPDRLSILEQDDSNIQMRLGSSASAVQGDGGNLVLKDQYGNVITDALSRDVMQNGVQVANATYDYRLTSGENSDGLYVNYGLTQLELQGKESDALSLNAAGKTGNAADLSAKVTGSGDLAVDTGADGTVTLSNSDNDYQGKTFIRSGKLAMQNDHVLGQTAELVMDAGTGLVMNGHSQTVGAINSAAGSLIDLGNGDLTVGRGGTLDGNITGAGTLNLAAGLLNINGANGSLTAVTNIASGAQALLNSASGLGQGSIVNQGVLSFTAAAGNLLNSLSGHGDVTLHNTSDIVLQGDNADFAGRFVLDSGTSLSVTRAESLGSAQVSNDGTLNILTSADWTLANNVAGSGSLNKNGAGVMTLSQQAANYTGTTAVHSGGLLLGTPDSTVTLASGMTEVAEGALFGGFGGTAGSVNNAGNFVVGSPSSSPLRALPQPTAFTVGGNLNNSGNISVGQAGNGSVGNTLNITGDYHGDGGRIHFNTALGDDSSVTDHMTVNGATSGTTAVSVSNAGGLGGKTIYGIELINVKGASDGEFTQDGRIVAGAYDYRLARGKGNNAANWYLTSGSDEGGGEGAVDPGKPEVVLITRPESAAYASNMAAANTLFNTRLQDRLGETHYVDALTGEKKVTSMWLRNVGGHTRSSDSSGQLHTQANRWITQLGGDIAQWSSDGDDRFHLGVMAGYANQHSSTRNNVSGHNAKGSINGYSTGVYATWLQDNAEKTGAYVDSWAQYSWFNNTVAGDTLKAENYKSDGFTASVEAGYTWKLGEKNERESYYLQPKAQVTWMGVEMDSLNEANGTRVSGKGDGNIQTRLGIRAFMKGHNKIDDGKQRTFEPFVEANWIANTKNFGSTLNGVTINQRGTRNIGELKVGVEGQLNPNLNLWGNIGQQMGDKGYSDSSAMVGVKVNF